MGDGLQVPEDLQAKGWRSKESTKHRGHWYYYHVGSKKAFWKLSQVYAQIAMEERRAQAGMLPPNSWDRKVLRWGSCVLVAVGLAYAFVGSYACSRDPINIFSASLVLVGAYITIIHTLLAPFLVDTRHFLAPYAFCGVLASLYQAVIFSYAAAVDLSEIEPEGEPAWYRSVANFGTGLLGMAFAQQLTFSDSLDEMLDVKGARHAVLGTMLGSVVLQFAAAGAARRRAAAIAPPADEDGGAEASLRGEKAKLLANEGGLEAGTQSLSHSGEDDAGHLMNFYDQLFRQYGVERPEGILEERSTARVT
jgi:hypothetical protein